MDIVRFSALLLSVLLSAVLASSEPAEFVAAVYEHNFGGQWVRVVYSRPEALAIMMRNMDVYEAQMKKANEKNVSIIVFPEYGLTGFQTSRETFRPFMEDVPDPETVHWNACNHPQSNTSTPVLYRLSCLAKEYNMYLVLNIGDVKPCNVTTDKHCPADGRYQYNTNVVFDSNGFLVARYHKEHPFLSELTFLNRPLLPEYITFESPFGKFGTFICFDVLFKKPAITLVEKYSIDHVVFPTAWFDVLPLFAAVGFHSSWARGMRVNFLAANSHTPALLNTGSGIYAPEGAKTYYRSLFANGSLLIATLSSKPREALEDQDLNDVVYDEETGSNTTEAFYSELFGDLFLFKELRESEGTLHVCYNESRVCCSLAYKMAGKRSDELYAFGIFDGLHTLEGQYYIRVCTLIKCLNRSRNTCGQRTYEAKTIFESIALKADLQTKYVYPQLVADGVSLLPTEWTHNNMPVNQLQTKQRLSKGLLTAALFGRVYKWDNGTQTSSAGVSCGFNGLNLFVSLVIMLVYFVLC